MKNRDRSRIKSLLEFLYGGILILFFHTSASAQELYSKTFTTRDGLPSSYIFNTYEDKLGYLWIGTAGGLCRFDGKVFTNYGFSEGLPDLRTDAMLMDSKMRFWAGTRRGMAILKQNRFLTYPVSDSLHISFVFSFIETKKGSVLALTDVGIYEFDKTRWQKLNEYPGYENKPCRGIIENDDGLYFNYGNIVVLKKENNQFKQVAPYNELGYYYNRLSQSGSDIFISTSNGIFRIQNEQLIKVPGIAGLQKKIGYYFFDSKKNCWIASEKNGLQFIPGNDSLNIKTFYKRPAINLISGINEDSHGNLWVADFSGLVRITESEYKIYDLPKLQGKGVIRNIIRQRNGPILINDGTTNLKIFENGISGEKKLYLKGNSVLPKNEMVIDNYAVDDKNRYWYALRSFDLAMQEGNTLYGKKDLFPNLHNDIFDVLFDKFRKKVLVSAEGHKFPCLVTDTGINIFHVRNNIEVKGNIMHLYQCVNDNIVFYTDKGIIYSINKENICKQQLNEFNSTPSFRKFLNDPGGDLWIIYNGRGIRRYTWHGDSLVFKEKIDKSNGLPEDNVGDLCFDDKGNMWVLTNSGVLELSVNNVAGGENIYKPIAFFNGTDLNIEDSYNYKLINFNDGKIWLGTGRQLISFYPKKIKKEAIAPGIQIENIKLNLQQTDWSLYADSLSGIFGLPIHLRLPYNKNTLGFNYSAVFPYGTREASFSYILDDLDSTWSPQTNSDFVSFVNLPAGKYHFKVKARLPNTGWSRPALFSFEIKEAFWETWWFRLLIIIIASALIVGIFQYRLNQIRSKAELKNQLQELESKALKAQMNPHFIFNAMNSIQSLIINNRTEQAGTYISKFARLMRHILENADANLVNIEKELYSLQLYIDLEKLRMHVDLDYVEDIDPELEIHQEKIPSLILQPFVENALWHGLSKKEGDKRLTINIQTVQGWIICKITDNGVGRLNAADHYDQLPEGHLSRATGITQQRLISYNNTPEVQPIEIIDLKDDAGNPAGTTVIIRIKRKNSFTG